MGDPYQILGVAHDASDDEIKRAYRKLARKYHPDVNPGDKSAEEKMKEVNNAYQTIQDMRSGKKMYGQSNYGNTADAGQAYNDGYGKQYYSQEDIYEFFRRARSQYDNQNAQQNYSNRGYRPFFFQSSFSIVRFLLLFFILQWIISLLFGGLFSAGYSNYGGQGNSQDTTTESQSGSSQNT